MELIDTHTHLYEERFSDETAEVIARATEAGVRSMIVPATKPGEFGSVIELTEHYPGTIHAAIGIHPHHAAEVDDRDLERVEELCASGVAVAVGEIGLDYYYNFAPKERQHEVFREQLRIAKRLHLPAVIHNRESDEDVLKLIEEEQDGTLAFQLHCFSSDVGTLQRALDLGAMISFTGNITYKKSTLDEVVQAVPDDRIMIETDAPYMTPVPYRGNRNEPSYVRFVAQKIADLRGQSLEHNSQMTTANAQRFFKLIPVIIAIFGLLCSVSGATAQTTISSTPVDTTRKSSFPRWVGIGGHLASSTYIDNESQTIANAVFSNGFWISLGPFEHLDMPWLRLDVIYTKATNKEPPSDTTYRKLEPGKPVPPNYHTTFDIKLRFIGNVESAVSFFASLGLTSFHNDFGLLRYYAQNNVPNVPHDFEETNWGIGGSIGLSVNIETPYGIISPVGEWQFASMFGDRITSYKNQKLYLSQQRFGILLYPNFGALFGK